MKIKFLGSGSAFVIPERDNNYQSNILITKTVKASTIHTSDLNTLIGDDELTTRTLLIDAGEQIASSLHFNGYNVTDIDAVFITHNHSDHNAGLNYIGFKTYFIPPFGTNKPILFGNKKVLTTLWDHVLKGNMESLNDKHVGLDEYFEVCSVSPKQSFNFLGTQFTPVRVPHIIDDLEEVPAYGLKWEEDEIKFFFSGDTQFDFWRLFPFWEEANIIFQDCEMMNYDGGVHAQFRQLKEIPDHYKCKMYLYHYIIYDGRTFEEVEQEVLNAGFAGLISRGQEFDTLDIKNSIISNLSKI